VSVFGSNFGSAPTVTVGGKAAYIAFGSNTQVNMQIPVDVGLGTKNLVVTNGAQSSPTFPLQIVSYAPIILVQAQAAHPLGLITHPDATLVSEANPSFPGEVLKIYALGLGPVTSQPPTGSPGPTNPLSDTTSTVTVTFGGQSLPAILSYLSPTGPGAYEVQFAVPALTSSGEMTVTIGVGGATSNQVFCPFSAPEFNDVPASATFFVAANLMFQQGVTTGCVQSNSPQTREYCPNDNVTRQEMAAFIVRAVTGTTNPAIYNTTPYFNDVPTSNSFFPHIQKLMELGITTGCSANPPLFCPTNTIPRWEMAIFMIRARLMLHGATFSYDSTPYFADVPTDVEGNGQPFPFIQRAYEEHVTNGCGTNPLVFCPDGLVTRGQMASFIMRALFDDTTILSPGAPQLTGVSPNALPVTLGSQITVTITGANTKFQTGDTVSVPSLMLDVSNVVVNSATSITATLTNSTTLAGPQALMVTTGGQNLTLPLAIKVGTY
jgi:uncharacterized protein (TIGR03437 family)